MECGEIGIQLERLGQMQEGIQLDHLDMVAHYDYILDYKN